MNYQRKDLASGSPIGNPAPLPHELVGLSDHDLADLSFVDPVLGYKGQGFFVVVPTLDDAKRVKSAQIELAYGTRFANGFPCVIQGHGETLQMRPEDLVNWLVFKDACDDGIAAGHGADANLMPIRATSNNMYVLTNNDGRALMIALRSYGAALMHNHWVLNDALTSAADEAAVEAIDVAAGWPDGGFSV